MNPHSPIKTRNQRKAAAQAQRRADPVRRSLEQSVNTEQRALAREDPAVRARDSAQQAVAREDPVVRSLERSVDNERRAVAREDPEVRARESAQRAVARSERPYEMACKFKNGQYIFHQPCGLWNQPCVHGCGYIHLSSSTPGTRKKCCVNGRLSSVSDNFDEELMMDNVLDELPSFVRKVISSNRANFSQKSSTYNNLVAMAATVVCNYNETAGFSRRGLGPQSVFMNGRVHHYMRIASSTSQNCGISYFIFDDIASLAGSADVHNVDPLILSDIC